jgi:hypothetical protein
MILSLQIVRASVQATNILAIAHNTNSIAFTYSLVFSRIFTLMTPATICNDPFVSVVITGITAIIGVLRAVGVALTIHGIVMGGLTRMLSFGDQRRISQSNREIIEAIVGLIIVLLSAALGNQIPVWFGLATHTCLLGPASSSMQG